MPVKRWFSPFAEVVHEYFDRAGLLALADPAWSAG
jgi:hypothetical protein